MSVQNFIKEQLERGNEVTPELRQYAHSQLRFDRITFKEAMKVSPNIIAGLLVWIGVTCSPSQHMFGRCNNRRHR